MRQLQMQNKFFLEYRRHKISTGYFLVFLFTCAYGISCIIQRDFSFVNIFFIILALAGFLISLRTDYICGLYIDGTNLKFYGKIFTFKINVNEIKYIKLSKNVPVHCFIMKRYIKIKTVILFILPILKDK